MRIGIIGDCHLGASLKAGTKDPVSGIHSRLNDYYTTLLYAIKEIVEKDCKTIIFTGDIFEHRYPHMLQQKLFSQALRYAVDLGIEKIYIIVGNHDQQRNSSTTTLAYLGELKLDNIVIVNDPQVLRIGAHRVYMYPYRDRRYLECSDYQSAITKTDEQIREMRANENSPGAHVMIGHMAIEGTFFPEEESELYTDNELMLLKSSFVNYDITIMGHVHSPGQISMTPPIYYIGSLEKRGAFESHKKQYMVLDLDQKVVDWFALPCRDFFEFEFDLSDKLYGAELMPTLKEKIFQIEGVKDNIVKTEIIIQTDDLGHLDIEKVSLFFKDKEPQFVFPPVPTLRSSRQSRSELKESVSDTETWATYVKAVGLDAEFAEELIQIGSSIISEEH